MRQKLKFFLFLLAILAAGGNDLYGQTSGLRFRVGLGYDYFSQEFFNDTLAAPGADSLAVATAIKTAYLDDVKAMVEARWRDSRRIADLRGTVEQTPHLIRLKFQSNYKPKWNRLRLDWFSEVSGQQKYRDSVKSGDEYALGQTRAKLTYALSQNRAVFGQLRADAVAFGQQSTYIYNYRRAGGSVGIMQTFAGLSAATLEFFYLYRGVPDSSELNYKSYGLNASFLGDLGPANTDLSTRVERRDLGQPDGLADFTRVDVFARLRWDLGGWWRSVQEVTLEGAGYRNSDSNNSDYYRLQAAVVGGVERGKVGISLGPVADLFDESGTGVVSTSDYLELGAKGVFEYQDLGGIFVTFEPVLARRDYKNEGDFQADFTALRLGLIGDLDFGRGLGFNVLGSAEWEWYADSGQDNRVYLVSGGLTYAF